MNGRIVRVAALTVGIVLVGGCAGGTAATAEPIAEATIAATVAPTPAPTAIPTATPKPTPTPEPTPDLALIGADYLRFAAKFTAAQDPIFDEFAAREHNEEEYIALHQQVVDAYDEAIADMQAIEFPADLADEVAGMSAALTDVRDAFESVTTDPSIDAFPVLEVKAAEYGKLADAVRKYLGLPPRQTPQPS